MANGYDDSAYQGASTTTPAPVATTTTPAPTMQVQSTTTTTPAPKKEDCCKPYLSYRKSGSKPDVKLRLAGMGGNYQDGDWYWNTGEGGGFYSGPDRKGDNIFTEYDRFVLRGHVFGSTPQSAENLTDGPDRGLEGPSSPFDGLVVRYKGQCYKVSSKFRPGTRVLALQRNLSLPPESALSRATGITPGGAEWVPGLEGGGWILCECCEDGASIRGDDPFLEDPHNEKEEKENLPPSAATPEKPDEPEPASSGDGDKSIDEKLKEIEEAEKKQEEEVVTPPSKGEGLGQKGKVGGGSKVTNPKPKPKPKPQGIVGRVPVVPGGDCCQPVVYFWACPSPRNSRLPDPLNNWLTTAFMIQRGDISESTGRKYMDPQTYSLRFQRWNPEGIVIAYCTRENAYSKVKCECYKLKPGFGEKLKQGYNFAYDPSTNAAWEQCTCCPGSAKTTYYAPLRQRAKDGIIFLENNRRFPGINKSKAGQSWQRLCP